MIIYQTGDYIKVLAKSNEEARIIVQVVAGDSKPLRCMPSSEANTLQGFFDLEPYAEAEVRMAKPEEYSLKDSLARVKDVFYRYFTDFRNQVSQEQQFKAFQEVITRFGKDERAGASAQAVMDNLVENFNRTPGTPWHTIVLNFYLDPRVPASGYEVLAILFLQATQRYTMPPRDADMR